jgi:hypothetical protein
MDDGYAGASEIAARLGNGIRYGQLDQGDDAWCVIVARGVDARIMVEVSGVERSGISSTSPTGTGWFLRHLRNLGKAGST